MINRVRLNLELLEQMIYFWQASSENEKVAESYLETIAQSPALALIYDDQLDAAGVRKVLSAITNRERMNEPTAREWKLWNNNMWAMEDMGLLDSMVSPLKVLNADALADAVNARGDVPHPEVEIIFIPGTTEEYLIDGSRLVVNFFKVTADLYEEDKVTVDGKPVAQYLEEKLLEM